VAFSDRSPVVWTRGSGCLELARLLSDAEPIRAAGDLEEVVISVRGQLVVSRRLSSFDLASQVVPVGFDPSEAQAIVAAVAGGPHSPLAARVAARLGSALGVPAMMVCAHRDERDRDEAVSQIERLYREVPHIEYRLVEADDAGGVVEQLPSRSAIVLGAPGGSWLQRTFFGQGARLRQEAPAGAVVVRQAPMRVFHRMGDPVFVGPLREAVDILRVHAESVLAVVDRAMLVGIVRRSALELADPGVLVTELMEEPQSVLLTADLGSAAELAPVFAPSPIPVTDEDGRLVGGLAL
jgi:hypothetical protein